MLRRLAALALVVVMAAGLFSGCNSVKLAPGQVKGYVHDWFSADNKSFDVQECTTLQDYGLARELFSTLVRYKGNTFELEPELLAEMPTVDATKTVYTFKLRSGVKFHDGSVLTANDVKYTFERMLNPDGVGASTWLYQPIKGAQEMADKKATELSGFKVLNELEFEITLSQPYAPFLSNLAVPCASIYSKAAVTAAGDKWSQQPVGTGPFMLEKYIPDQLIVFKKNPNYFEPGVPSAPGVDYRIIADEATAIMEFEKGILDFCSPTDPAERARIEKTGKFSLLSSTPLITYYISMNMNDPAFKDIRVRQAIAMAIDRKSMVDNLRAGAGVVATGFVTPGIPGAFDVGKGPAPQYDVAAAKALVAEIGKPIKLELWQRGGETANSANVAIQGFLKEVGIDCEIKIYDSAAFRKSRGSGVIPLYYGNWLADIPDADNYLWTYFYGPSGDSKSMSVNYGNKTVFQLLEKARFETDATKRNELYQQAETIILKDDVAFIPLFHTTSFVLTSKNISGYAMHPTGVGHHRATVKAANTK